MNLLRLPVLRTLANARFRTGLVLLVSAETLVSYAAFLPVASRQMVDWRLYHQRLSDTLHGIDPYRFFHPGAYGAAPDFYLTPPGTLMLLPLGFLSYDASVVAMIALNQVLLLLGLWLFYRLAGSPSLAELSAAVAVAVTFGPVRQNLADGQTSLLVMDIVLATCWLARDRGGIAGAVAAAGALFRVTPAGLLLLLLARRRWAGVSAFLAVIAVGCGLSVLYFGSGVVGTYLQLTAALARGSAWVINQSWNGTTLRLLAPRQTGVPIPPLPALVGIVASAGPVIVVAILVLHLRREAGATADAAVLAVAVPLLSSLVYTHYFAADLVALWLVLRLARRDRLPPALAAAAAGAFLYFTLVDVPLARYLAGLGRPLDPLLGLAASAGFIIQATLLAVLVLALRRAGTIGALTRDRNQEVSWTSR